MTARQMSDIVVHYKSSERAATGHQAELSTKVVHTLGVCVGASRSFLQGVVVQSEELLIHTQRAGSSAPAPHLLQHPPELRATPNTWAATSATSISFIVRIPWALGDVRARSWALPRRQLSVSIVKKREVNDTRIWYPDSYAVARIVRCLHQDALDIMSQRNVPYQSFEQLQQAHQVYLLSRAEAKLTQGISCFGFPWSS